jgi:iron complex transport system substrate-binding protein
MHALLTRATRYPQRIVCLTEETTETLYRLGAGDRVVGVTGFTVRPPEARKKPKVSSFLDANFERIVALAPDLVIGFSDLQAGLGAELAKRGIPVVLFNQRSVSQILQTIRATGALVGLSREAELLADSLARDLDALADQSSKLPRRPRVFFEEWPDPLISGIRWCSELIELCGGVDVCSVRDQQGAAGRIVTSEAIAQANPEVVIASWCGKKAVRKTIAERHGWAKVSAVVDDQLYEVKSAFILQPGPASLSDGARQVAAIIAAVASGERLPARRAGDLRQSGLSPTYPTLGAP